MVWAWAPIEPQAAMTTKASAANRLMPQLRLCRCFRNLFRGFLRLSRSGRRRRHRHDLAESVERLFPARQHLGRDLASGPAVMLLDQRAQLMRILARDLARHYAVHVQLPPFDRISDAAGHPGASVPADRAQRHRDTAGHVLAEVIARALDHRDRARVAHAEALAHTARDEEPAAGGAVGDRVAGKHRLGRRVVREGLDRDHPAAHALADVVLGLAFERELDVAIEKRSKALPGAAPILSPLAMR